MVLLFQFCHYDEPEAHWPSLLLEAPRFLRFFHTGGGGGKLGRLSYLLDQSLSVESLDMLQRSIECICRERGIDIGSDEGADVAQRALNLFHLGTCDESDLRQAIRKTFKQN